MVKAIIGITVISMSLLAADTEITIQEQQITPRISKEKSRDFARKITTIITQEPHEHIEKAITRTLSKRSEYPTIDLSEQRMHALTHVESVEDELNVDFQLKDEVTKWAIRELAARNNYEHSERKKESKKKIIASIFALITTAISIAGPIITIFATCESGCQNNINVTNT